MALAPSLGSASQGLTVSLQGNPSWSGPAHLVAALGREVEGFSLPGVDGLVHVALSSFVWVFVLPVSASGTAQLSIPSGSLPPALFGLPIYLQAVIDGGGLPRLSDLGLVVLGP
jgi:hypothetical protein